MANDKEVFRGYLLLPPLGKLLIKKTWQQKYCLLFKASKFGKERLEVYDTPDCVNNSTPKIIVTLCDCIKIVPKGDTYLFVTTKETTHEFEATDLHSRNEWLSALQSVAFPEDVSRVTTIEEDNDLYCPSGEGVFNVKLHSSPASERCKLEPKMYTLLLTSTAIQLRNINDNKLLYIWPYCYIRRYGCKQGKFTFEAGRKCDSGEGIFFVEHSNQQEIFRCLVSKLKSMKKFLKGDPSSPVLDCGDNQFHAALSMEARSRSPLPPSPTTSTTLHELESNFSQISSNSSDNSFKAPFKQIPPKPARKIIHKQVNENSNCTSSNNNSFSSTTGQSQSDYEPIDKYDHVEYRSDAWRTLGVDNVSHTEFIEEEDEDIEYMSWGVSRNKTPHTDVIQDKEEEEDYMSWGVSRKVPVAPKILTQTSKDSNSYDKLNFFGSTSKLSSGKSLYKQVNAGIVHPNNVPISCNDYDEVQPAMESVRLADDSHLGYALIRKEAVKGKIKDEAVNHQIYNDEPYAVISKPKRV